MKTKMCFVAMLLALAYQPATAGIVSGMTADTLMEKCRYVEADFKKLNGEQLNNVAVCMSYISGVIDGYAVGVTTSSAKRAMLCDMPDEVTMKETALIVLRYLRGNPAELHLPASIVTMKALNKAFPCRV